MAFEIPGFCPAAFVAASDLSSKQYYCVKLNTVADQVALCDTDGELVFGVLQNDPASGEEASVMLSGITKVIAGETLVKGMTWGVDANGKAKETERTATGADLGDFVMGRVIEGASAGELATVDIGFVVYPVTA